MPSTSLHGIQIKRLQDHNYGRQDLKRSPEQSVGDIHRSENVEQAQQCWSSCHRKWSSAMLRSPFWLKQFGSIVCCPYLFQFDCQYCTEGNKPYDCTSFVFRCKRSKWRKANKKEVTFSRKLWLIMTCHHVMSAPFRHLKVLLGINMSLALLFTCFVLSSQALLFLLRVKSWLNSRMGSERCRLMASLCHNSRQAWGLLGIFSSVVMSVVTLYMTSCPME